MLAITKIMQNHLFLVSAFKNFLKKLNLRKQIIYF